MPLQSKFAVEDLPEEVLLSVFKHLGPNQIQASRWICSRWLKVIDENKSLWRIVDHIDHLDFFDYKSESSLTEVSATFHENRRREFEEEKFYEGVYEDAPLHRDFNEDEDDAERLYDTLLRSSETLRLVDIECRHPKEVIFRELRGLGSGDEHITLFWSLSELVWHFPKLEDFRLTSYMDQEDVRDRLRDYPYPGVKLIKTSKSESNNQEGSHYSTLKVLWIDHSDDLFGLHAGYLTIASHAGGDDDPFARKGFLNNLTSLSTWDRSCYETDYWREILKVPSQNLKHLRIGFRKGKDQVPALNFPKLEVFEFLGDSEYLNWMIIPKTTVLVILSFKLPSGLPNVSELWSRVKEVEALSNTCPSLETLHLGECFRLFKEFDIRHAYVGNILEMVKERLQKEAAGTEIGGVRMKSIKSLTFGFELSRGLDTGEGEEALEELKKLVQLSDNDGELDEPILEI